MYPIIPSADIGPLPNPRVDTIDRANPDKSSGSGDVLITHQHGVLITSAVRPSSSMKITSVGTHDDGGAQGYYHLARSYYLGNRWVYQGYTAESKRNSARRRWWCAVIDTSPIPRSGTSKYYRKPRIYEASQGYNYRISDDAHPYDEFPDDVLEMQLTSVLVNMPDEPAYNGTLNPDTYLVEDVDISSSVYYLDPVDVTNYWRSKVWGIPSSSNLNGGFSEAYYQALSKLPQLEQNLFQNILELVTVIRSFMDGFQPSDLTKLEDLKKAGQSAWLAYRYQYATTVSDLMEVTTTLNRLHSLLSKRYVRSYGIGHNNGMTCHCCVVVDMGTYIDSLGTYLSRLNLRLTLYNVWDMLPYSFVVDWFLHIGDILHQLQEWLDAPSFPVTEIWYSFYTIQSDNSASTEIYGRWRGSAPSLPYIDVSSVSRKTIFMRIADVLSLFF